jgi:hypothetical protein
LCDAAGSVWLKRTGKKRKLVERDCDDDEESDNKREEEAVSFVL